MWLLLGPKAGDNTQLEALGSALGQRFGWRIDRRRLAFHRWELLVNLLLRVTTWGLRRADSDALEPPWPDLILTAGRRNEPVARWIRRRAARETGRRPRLVHVGRPWAHPRRFDLVVTTPQYFLEPEVIGAAPVLINDLPLAPEVRRTADLDALALLVGGDSGAKVLSPAAAARLGRAALALARREGLQLFVTTSPRTSPDAESALARTLAGEADVRFHGWHGVSAALPPTVEPAANPYRAWLSGARAFIVTEDSMSMLAEAVGSGQPVRLARLPRRPGAAWRQRELWTWRATTHRLAQLLAPRRLRRDTERLITALLNSGTVRLLDDPQPPIVGSSSRDLERAVERVGALFPPAG